MPLGTDDVRALLHRYRRMNAEEKAGIRPILAEYDLNLDALAATGGLIPPEKLEQLQVAFERFDMGETVAEPNVIQAGIQAGNDRFRMHGHARRP